MHAFERLKEIIRTLNEEDVVRPIDHADASDLKAKFHLEDE
jgi:hypothetical protein